MSEAPPPVPPVSPGVLGVLQLVREGTRKRRGLLKRLGLGEQAEPWLKEAVSGGYVAEAGSRLSLTARGLELVLAVEQRRPVVLSPQRWGHEMWLDKGVGGVLIAFGIFLIYTGFNLGLQIFNTPAPQFQAPNLNLGSLLGGKGGEGDLGSALLGPLQQMFSSSIQTAFKAAGAGIVIAAGGALLGKGVQLFKRP